MFRKSLFRTSFLSLFLLSALISCSVAYDTPKVRFIADVLTGDIDKDLNGNNDKDDVVNTDVTGIKQNPSGNQLGATPATK